LLDGCRGRGAVGSVQHLVSTGVAASVVAAIVVVSTDVSAGMGTLHVARAIRVSGTLVVGVVLLHDNRDLGFAKDSVGDLLGNSPVDSDDLVTVLSNGLLNGDGLGNLDFAGDFHGALIVHNLGDSNLNLLDLVGANGHTNGVRHHDGLGDHDNLVNIADGGDLNLLGDGLVDRSVGHDGARNLDGLDVIHGVLNLLGSLAGNLDGLGVGDDLSPEGLNFLGAERGVGLLDGVLLRNIGVHGAGHLLRNSDAARMNTLATVVVAATVVVGVGNNGAAPCPLQF